MNALMALGGAAVAGSAAIHLRLWADGYSGIHTIGPLFLAQAIAGMILAGALVALRRGWAAVLAASYLLATAAGFLLSVKVGIFGFEDTWSAPFARTAFWDELAGSAVLLAATAACAVRAGGGPRSAPRS